MLLDADISGVIVATPHYLHAEHVVKIAEAGKHVLCEKPMARTIDECDRMIDACERNGVMLMPAHMKRFNWCFQLADRMIKGRDAGRCRPSSHPVGHLCARGGCRLHEASHIGAGVSGISAATP